MIIPGGWFVERVTVETFLGSGAYGDRYADPVEVFGHISGGRRVTRSTQGEEVTSDQRVMLPNPVSRVGGGEVLDPSQLLRPESRVTSGAMSSTVVQVAEHRQPGSGTLVYVSAALT